MKLNHLSLAVPNVAETSAFFEQYFDFKCTSVKGDNIIAVLQGEGDFTLVLTTAKSAEETYPKDFHFGFLLNSTEKVHEVYNRLIAGGVNLQGEPRKFRNSIGFYFIIPGGIMAEVSCEVS